MFKIGWRTSRGIHNAFDSEKLKFGGGNRSKSVVKQYDVFLSFKNLGPDGKPTRDSVLAEDIYQYLFARKLSVFLSTFELEAQGVSAYKKAIDAALDASRVVIAVGTSTENLESEWVRYEWDGFFNDIISGVKPDGRVFSYIDGVEFKSLPRALRQSQAITQRDGSLGWKRLDLDDDQR